MSDADGVAPRRGIGGAYRAAVDLLRRRRRRGHRRRHRLRHRAHRQPARPRPHARPRRHRCRADLVGQVPRPRRARRAATRTTDDDRRRAGQLAEEIELTKRTVGRRKLLVVLLGGAFVSTFVGFVGPIGSLGPKPRGERGRTSWTNGARLVTGRRHADRQRGDPFGDLVPCSPKATSASTTRRWSCSASKPELLTERTVEGGAVDGWVAYSKICTHAGCSVGLFGIDDREPDTLRQLVCPCHQSIFDPVDGARPVGGPATRSLPQLAARRRRRPASSSPRATSTAPSARSPGTRDDVSDRTTEART